MEQGLAVSMTYGNGEGNTIQHYYAGKRKNKKKGSKMGCKKKPGTKPKK